MNGRTLLLIVTFALCVASMIVEAMPGAVVVIAPDRLHQDARQGGSSLPVRTILGAVVDDAGKLILIGDYCDLCEYDSRQLLIELAAAVADTNTTAIRATPDPVPGSTRARLIYSGGIARTGFGKMLADSLMRFNLIADGEDELPLAFRKLPGVIRPTLAVSADIAGCRQAGDYTAVLLTGNPVRIHDRTAGEPDTKAAAGIWVAQLEQRFGELASIYPEFAALARYLQISALLDLTKRAKQPRKVLTGTGTAEKGYTPQTLSYRYDRNVVSDIIVRPDGDFNGCSNEHDLEALREAAIKAIGDRFPNAGWSRLDFDLSEWSRTYRLAAMVNRGIEAGTHGNTVWLDVRDEEATPRLRVLRGNSFYSLPDDAAAELIKIVDYTEYGHETVARQWSEFRERHLDELLCDNADCATRLVLVFDRPRPKLFRLSGVESLSDDLQVVVASRAGGHFSDAVLRTLDGIENVASIAYKDIGWVVSANDERLVKPLEALARKSGKEHLLVNPDRSELGKLLSRRDIKAVVLDMNMEDDAIMLGKEKLDLGKLLYMDRLDHIRLVIVGMFAMNHNLPDSSMVEAMQAKGVGMIAFAVRGAEGSPVRERLDRLLNEYVDASTTGTDPLGLVQRVLGYNPVLFEKRH